MSEDESEKPHPHTTFAHTMGYLCNIFVAYVLVITYTTHVVKVLKATSQVMFIVHQ